MTFTPQLDETGQWYWQAEIHLKDRLILAEGNTFSEALNNAIDLVLEPPKP